MKRDELEHVLRAAGAITAHDEIVVIGSQAILGSAPDAPADLTMSEEVDLYVPGDESASDLIDGSIGERSPFHETFGYYAHGVGPETAILPRGWRERAVVVRSRATHDVAGICPHPADLAISKLAAGREKDIAFVSALLRHGLTTVETVESLFDEIDRDTIERVGRGLRLAARITS